MENRNGHVVQADLTPADGRAEPRAAIDMIDSFSPARSGVSRSGGVASGRATGSSTAGDGFDSADFVATRAGCA